MKEQKRQEEASEEGPKDSSGADAESVKTSEKEDVDVVDSKTSQKNEKIVRDISLEEVKASVTSGIKSSTQQ